MKTQNYFFGNEIKSVDLGNGITRKVTAYNENLMSVENYFEEGAISPIHSHTNEQITYVVSGEFEFNIDGEIQIMKAGDSHYKQPNLKHGCKCLKAGILFDTFTPFRKDFL
jgi:quercetin dioxygenase-like cupin family protein